MTGNDNTFSVKGLTYTLIRSKRRSVAVKIRSDGGVEVRAPLLMPRTAVELFLKRNIGRINDASRERALLYNENRDTLLSEADIRELIKKAKKVIPEKCSFYAERIGLKPGRIAIRRQKTRWGSCSSKHNLNFNCLLMLIPDEVIDSVVVHELCHIKEMNHSKRFYDEILRVFPDYRRCDKWLKDNGPAILVRAGF